MDDSIDNLIVPNSPSYYNQLRLTKYMIPGAFLLTPSHDLSLDKAANICDKLNFRGSFSLTKTATGILFKFSEPEDYQQVFRKGFHKVTHS